MSHNSTQELGRAILNGNAEIRAVNGILQLGDKMFGVATLAAGTYTVPNVLAPGFIFSVKATGTVVLESAAAIEIVTLSNGQCKQLVSTSTSTWDTQGGTASDIGFADSLNQTTKTDVESVLASLLARTAGDVNTAITTVGAGTLTAAGIVGGLITRSGSTGAYTDTTDTATAIIAAFGITSTGISEKHSWLLFIKNTVAFAETITGGTGVTITGNSIVPPLSTGVFLVTYDEEFNAIEMFGVGSIEICELPNAKSATSAAASPVTVAAGILEGAKFCGWQNTTNGAVQVNTRTAAQIIAAIPNAQVGFTWIVEIASRGDNTVTLTAGDGNVTVTNGAVTTGTTRRFVCTIATATTVTMFGL